MTDIVERLPPDTTHACVVCAARWTQWQDGTWTLRSERCGTCCDNAPMGEQLARLYGEGEGYHTQEASEKRRAIELRKWQETKVRYKGEVCAICNEPFKKHSTDWSCNKKVVLRFKFQKSNATQTEIASLRAERDALRDEVKRLAKRISNQRTRIRFLEKCETARDKFRRHLVIKTRFGDGIGMRE